MLEKNRILVEENRNLVYKFLAQRHIFDEDMFQEMMLQVCYSIDKYNPEISQLSTWIYTVCENKLHQINSNKKRKKRIPDELKISLSTLVTGELSLNDILIDERSEDAFKHIEDKVDWNYCVELYKQKYPKTYKRDLDIFSRIALGETFESVASTYNFTRQNTNLIFYRVRDKLQNVYKLKKSSISLKREEDLYSYKAEDSNIQNTPIIISHNNDLLTHKYSIKDTTLNNKTLSKISSWLNNNIYISETYENSINSLELTYIISKDIEVDFTENDVKTAMERCGYLYKSINGHDVYSISNDSPIIKKFLKEVP